MGIDISSLVEHNNYFTRTVYKEISQITKIYYELHKCNNPTMAIVYFTHIHDYHINAHPRQNWSYDRQGYPGGAYDHDYITVYYSTMFLIESDVPCVCWEDNCKCAESTAGVVIVCCMGYYMYICWLHWLLDVVAMCHTRFPQVHSNPTDEIGRVQWGNFTTCASAHNGIVCVCQLRVWVTCDSRGFPIEW